MPRFFDDYSNTYLTHDSAAGRKQQRRGWKFRENFKLHYDNYLQEWRRGPMGLASAQQEYIRARGAQDPSIPPLPDGWKQEVDDVTQCLYYIDTNTGNRTWVRPGFIPPPPPGGGMGRGGPPKFGAGAPFRGGGPPQHQPYGQQQRGPPPPVPQPYGAPPPPQPMMHPNAMPPHQYPPPPPHLQHLPQPPRQAPPGLPPGGY